MLQDVLQEDASRPAQLREQVEIDNAHMPPLNTLRTPDVCVIGQVNTLTELALKLDQETGKSNCWLMGFDGSV
jgi:hypothetical protein